MKRVKHVRTITIADMKEWSEWFLNLMGNIFI